MELSITEEEIIDYFYKIEGLTEDQIIALYLAVDVFRRSDYTHARWKDALEDVQDVLWQMDIEISERNNDL